MALKDKRTLRRYAWFHKETDVSMAVSNGHCFSILLPQVKKRFMCSLCGKRYFTVTALKKHHAMHGENGGASASGGSSSLVTMDVDTKITAKTTSESATEPSDDDNAIDAGILEMEGLAWDWAEDCAEDLAEGWAEGWAED